MVKVWLSPAVFPSSHCWYRYIVVRMNPHVVLQLLSDVHGDLWLWHVVNLAGETEHCRKVY